MSGVALDRDWRLLPLTTTLDEDERRLKVLLVYRQPKMGQSCTLLMLNNFYHCTHRIFGRFKPAFLYLFAN
jgi:hypothetical protein